MLAGRMKSLNICMTLHSLILDELIPLVSVDLSMMASSIVDSSSKLTNTGGSRGQSPRRAAGPSQPTPSSKASSSTDGFFQSPPVVRNQLEDDQALSRALRLFLPPQVREAIQPELSAFADKVLSRPILDLVADAEKHPPYLKTWDSWGRRRDDLVTSEGWRKLGDIGVQEGMVAMGYENKYGPFSRMYHFAKFHLWAASSAWTTCPNQMTDGVAFLFRKHLSNPDFDGPSRKVLQSAYDRLTSRDPAYAWVTGQWMTERQGGSDVSQTETLARYAPDSDHRITGIDGMPLGPWLCDGFKWFSSATDCHMTVFLARTPKGISTFFAPMRKTLSEPDPLGYQNELNGVQIQRLKNKLGTRALPTAELVLKDVRAYLVGEEGKGTKEIASVLNVSRLHNAANSVSFWSRGLGIVRAFARCRKVGLQPLWSKAAYMRTASKLHVEYRGYTMLTLFVATVLGVAEQPLIAAFERQPLPPTIHATNVVPYPEDAEHLLRFLTPVAKGIACKAAVAGLAECMENLGGVGYLENEDMQFNMARLFRDANVCSIWEGTTDMMAHDVLRVVYGKTSQEVFGAMERWLDALLHYSTSHRELVGLAESVSKWWQDWREFVQTRARGEVELRSREVMLKLGDIVMGALLLLDAMTDEDSIAMEVVDAWFEERKRHGYVDASHRPWKEIVRSDMLIVFGHDPPGTLSAKL